MSFRQTLTRTCDSCCHGNPRPCVMLFEMNWAADYPKKNKIKFDTLIQLHHGIRSWQWHENGNKNHIVWEMKLAGNILSTAAFAIVVKFTGFKTKPNSGCHWLSVITSNMALLWDGFLICFFDTALNDSFCPWRVAAPEAFWEMQLPGTKVKFTVGSAWAEIGVGGQLFVLKGDTVVCYIYTQLGYQVLLWCHCRNLSPTLHYF